MVPRVAKRAVCTYKATEGEMRVRLGGHRISNDLLDFLRRSDCVAERLCDHVLEVNPRQEMLPHAARLEIEGLLRVWHRLHPEVAGDVDFVEERRGLPAA
jgi:hypothetical protein